MYALFRDDKDRPGGGCGHRRYEDGVRAIVVMLDDERHYEPIAHLHERDSEHVIRLASRHARGQSADKHVAGDPVEQIAFDRELCAEPGPGAHNDSSDEADGNKDHARDEVPELHRRRDLRGHR